MKLALCFLIYDKIECESIWETWIKNNEHNISIYIHSKFAPIIKTDYFVSNVQIVETVPTEWGAWGLVDATIQMFQEAVKDTSNTHFILLSGACVPVKKFSYVFDFLQKDERSFIHEANKNQRFPRYNKLLEYFKEQNISKHSAWVILNNKHTRLLVNNKDIIYTFYKNAEFPDESWALTYLNHLGLSHEICRNFCITYSNWENKGPSPKTFLEISEKEIGKTLRGPSLFARKFVGNTIVSGKNILLCDYLNYT